MSASQEAESKKEAVLRQRVRSIEETEMKHGIEIRAVGSKEAERMSYPRTCSHLDTIRMLLTPFYRIIRQSCES